MTSQPMHPDAVPGEILAAALADWTGHDDPLVDCDPDDIETAAIILAAVIPAIEQRVRAQVAEEIEAAAPEHIDPVMTLRAQAMHRAARIARGDA